MTHQVSPLGIVGLGALGRAVETFLAHEKDHKPAAVLFTVKAFDLEAALLEQATQWPDDIPFVTLTNGYLAPVLDKVKHVLAPRPLRVGMTTIGSTVGLDGRLTVFSDRSITAWGPCDQKFTPPTLQELERLRLFPNGQWQEDMRPLLRQKWIFNVVINSLSAAHRLSNNGSLEAYRSEAQAVLAEALQLAKLLWKDVPWDTTTADIEPTFSKRLWSLVEASSGNENSMARDLRLKKTTENDYLAGMAQGYDGFAILKNLHQQIVRQSK